MIRFTGWAILLDVEGTTSSVRFVNEVLFNYARQMLDSYLRSHWDTDEQIHAREEIARDAGAESFAAWSHGEPRQKARERLKIEVLRLMDRDAKTTGLKELQGLIWREGFEAGKLRAHIYPDVVPALRRWNEAGNDVRVYSSGSITAQRLFFGHTDVGDLQPFLKGHYDTTIGPKRSHESYAKIAADIGVRPEQILLLSDTAAELDAARAAGLQTALVARADNAAPAEGHGHPVIRDFSEIETAP
ncbi:MAG TPA: acireductone synthase [Pirellulales bacterium]|nr:acireductone synthase [Pirellulales bacterium]